MFIYLLELSIIILHCTHFGIVIGDCGEPSEPPANTTRVSDVKSFYKLNDPLVYKCDLNVGYGYVHIRCNNVTWDAPDRKCTDETKLEAGFWAGLVAFLLTLFITVLFLVLATRYVNLNDPDAVIDLTAGKAEGNKS